MKWISVKEKLPPENVSVLVYAKEKEIEVSPRHPYENEWGVLCNIFLRDGKWWLYREEWGEYEYEVSHWMHYPDEPSIR